MPLTIRPQRVILETIIASLLAGDIVTDVSPISAVRQLCEGLASTQADLEYDLYSLSRSFYLTTAEGLDLDIRGADHNLRRDVGQAASDPVTFYALPTHVDDILLPAPQALRATLADGTEVLYRSLGDSTLRPSGRSISGPAPATTLTGGTHDQLTINLDGDGPRLIALGTQTTAVGIAAAVQAAVRALTALTPSHQSAYNLFRCDYGVTTPGCYTLRSGTAGAASSCVVTAGSSPSLDATGALKLGVAQGGQEMVGQASLAVTVVCDTIGVLGNVGAGQVNSQVAPVTGIEHVANALMFSNGREPASDDAYRQDIRSYLLALGRGTRDALERAVAQTVGADGQQHVMSSQVVYGAGAAQAFVCDGRSLTVGAQSDVIQDVQDEVDGLGVQVGGWVPAGNVCGVASAQIVSVPIDVTVVLGPTPDLVAAQSVIVNALYRLLYQWGVGESMSYMQAAVEIDRVVAEVLDVTFTLPVQWSANPPLVVGGGIGQKIMPATLAVRTVRA